MSASVSNLDPVEIRFILEDIMQVNILNYMEHFQQIKVKETLDEVEQIIETISRELPMVEHSPSAAGSKIVNGKIISPSFHKQKWEKIIKKYVTGLTAPTDLEGQQLPETIAVVLSESLAGANPALHSMAMMSSEISRLIAEMGTKQLVDTYCPKINSGAWTATLSVSESSGSNPARPVSTVAILTGDCYLIKGTKVMIPAGDHNLTDNIVHLVIAKLGGSTEKKEVRGLFLVPKFHLRGGELEDNNLQLEKIHFTPGNQCLPYCCVSYGKKGETTGALLAIIEEEGQNYLQGIHHQLALQALGIMTAAHNRISTAREMGILELDDPYTRNRFIQIQAFIAGLRGALYKSAFYLDCSRHGGEQQKDVFKDLAELQIQIMKVYASHRGREIIDLCSQLIGVEAFSDDYNFGQNQQDLSALCLLAGTNDQISSHLYGGILLKNEGRSFQGLLNELQSGDMAEAKTDSLREAIGIWRDYLGGAIVLFDEIAKPSEEKQEEPVFEKIHLYTDKSLLLLGDLIIGYHLIIQGIEAEKKLVKLEANFFNLQQEAISDPELRGWYNKTLLAEFFAVNILSQQDGQIPVIQRNSLVALEAL